MPIRVVLVSPHHPGNVGAVARAMKTMGLRELWLVNPQDWPAPEARWRAAAAEDLIDEARLVGSVREAVADCGLVVGTTARRREQRWKVHEPREAADDLVLAAEHSDVALLFGNERSGLSNEELQQCQLLLNIPSSTHYSSLNLGMAVQIVAYELFLARRARDERSDLAGDTPLATVEDMERFYAQFAEVLVDIDFKDRHGSDHLMQRLRRLFNRAVLDQNEANILRGFLTAVQGRRRRAGAPPVPRSKDPA